ncbi:MAG: amidohydrolase [Phycisphaerales bacterium]|nr:amidohydrolase [Planctomycetota bacterium]MCH8509628.1 amidohydrolase [Phycisphaerales bacterium]
MTDAPPPTGLTEHHAHLLQLGRSLSMADLSKAASREDMLERLDAHARGLPPEAWLLAHAARPEAWPDPRWPGIADLDRVAGGRPLCAWCFDYHALAANTEALRRAGISPDSRFEHGRVVLDDRSQPTGVLLEHAALALWSSVPEPSESDRAPLLLAACRHLADLGYQEAHDLKAQPWLGAVLADLDRAGELPLRVRLYALLEDLDHLYATRRDWQTDRVTLAGGKIFVDGTLNSRTAWMLHPYAEAPPGLERGLPMMTPDEIETAVRRADALNLPLAAHAIGDGAVRAVLDAVERARPKAAGFRIEHAELIDAADVPRFARLGVTASLQPCHLLADIEALGRAVPDRLDRVLPIRDLLESGLTPGSGVVFGSDVPIVRADPGDSIQAAVHRRRANMSVEQAVSPEQSVDEPTAWACFRTA